MSGLANTQRIPAVLLVAYLAHFAEEWYGEITVWAQDSLGYEVSITRLLLINGIALLLFTAGTITALALYIPLSAWVLRRSTTSLSNPVIWRSIVAGVLFHGLVTFLAVI